MNSRVLLYVNGWQFGKYVSNLGPQTSFPVPEGVLNHRGMNTVGLSLWAMSEGGAGVEGLELRADGVVETGMEGVVGVGQPVWVRREGAY